MPFIHNEKFKEIKEAGKNNNEKALIILQALRNKKSQADLDRLVDDYYRVEPITPESEETALASQETDVLSEFEEQPVESKTLEEVANESVIVDDDIFGVLDNEFNGLIDENEIEELGFSDFLNNKRRDGLRARKNSDYFKAYDASKRDEYLQNKVNNYKSKFDIRLRDIERGYNDLNNSIDKHIQSTTDMLDDGVELDMNNVSSAYDNFIDNESAMHSLGRHWDEADNNNVMLVLKELVSKYGKQNVIAMLNTLKSDNDNHRKYLNNQIDTEIGRYTKSIENLLK